MNPAGERTHDARREQASVSAERPASLLAKTLASFAHLLAGNGSATMLNGLVMVVMARMLGPAALGLFAMIESYGTMVDQVIRLETWQPMIRYGSEALERGDRARFLALIKLGITVDVIGASLAAVIAFAAIPLVAVHLGWDAQCRSLARWYCLAVLAGVSSTPIALLRLFDRFKRIAWLEPAAAFVRLAGIGIAFALGGSLAIAIFIFVAAQLVYRAALGGFAWHELRCRGLTGVWQADWHALRGILPGYRRLTLSVNLAALVRKSTQELDVLILGGLAGPAAAGVYELVRRITLAAIKAGTMLQQVAFPDLGRLWARRDIASLRKLIAQVEGITATMGVAFVVVVAVRGQWLVSSLAGNRFRDAALPLVVQAISAALFLCGSTIRAALIIVGREREMLGIVLLSAAAFYATLYLAVPRWGATGASAAHVAFNLVLLPLAMLAYKLALRDGFPSTAPHRDEEQPAPGSPPRSRPAFD